MALLYAIIAGIMIHISIYELIPAAYKTIGKKSLKMILKYLIMGILIMLLSHFLIA